jgi:hypothetical protein
VKFISTLREQAVKIHLNFIRLLTDMLVKCIFCRLLFNKVDSLFRKIRAFIEIETDVAVWGKGDERMGSCMWETDFERLTESLSARMPKVSGWDGFVYGGSGFDRLGLLNLLLFVFFLPALLVWTVAELYFGEGGLGEGIAC